MPQFLTMKTGGMLVLEADSGLNETFLNEYDPDNELVEFKGTEDGYSLYRVTGYGLADTYGRKMIHDSTYRDVQDYPQIDVWFEQQTGIEPVALLDDTHSPEARVVADFIMRDALQTPNTKDKGVCFMTNDDGVTRLIVDPHYGGYDIIADVISTRTLRSYNTENRHDGLIVYELSEAEAQRVGAYLEFQGHPIGETINSQWTGTDDLTTDDMLCIIVHRSETAEAALNTIATATQADVEAIAAQARESAATAASQAHNDVRAGKHVSAVLPVGGG